MYNLVILEKDGKTYVTYHSAPGVASITSWAEMAQAYTSDNLKRGRNVEMVKDIDFEDPWQYKWPTFDEFKKDHKEYQNAVEVSLEELCKL